MKKAKNPNFNEEIKLLKKGFKAIAGLDEAGRGSLCGPVVAGAVFLDYKFLFQNNNQKIKSEFDKIRDSKKLSPKKREYYYRLIKKSKFIFWAVGIVSEKVIDKINILKATKLAMKKAVNNLNSKLRKKSLREIDCLILDGNIKIDLPIFQKSIIKADEKVISCAIASIVAKITRDKIMEKYDKVFPNYSFKKNKGYGTKEHYLAIKKYGLSPIHRLSFNLYQK
jgi:ribonuclease HII